MSEISAGLVRDLRDKTGAGMMDCKRALGETKGDLEKAIVYLREKGLAAAAKRASRAATEGTVGSYIHAGGKIGVLIEVNCETDFVARTPQFQALVKELAMQVAAANPRYVVRDEVPASVLETERDIYRAQAAGSGKPAPVIEKIVDGKIDKFIDLTDVKSVLELHPFIPGEHYYLGIFLSGAYQEILGDLHNLFGDTDAVHIHLTPGGYQVEHVIKGDSMTEVLQYVQYDRESLLECLRRQTEKALREKHISLAEARLLLQNYESSLNNYTYLS